MNKIHTDLMHSMKVFIFDNQASDSEYSTQVIKSFFVVLNMKVNK